jgi:hypothetical protein
MRHRGVSVSHPVGSATISLRVEATGGMGSHWTKTPEFPISRVVPTPSYQFPSTVCHWNQTLPVIGCRALFRLSSRCVSAAADLESLSTPSSRFLCKSEICRYRNSHKRKNIPRSETVMSPLMVTPMHAGGGYAVTVQSVGTGHVECAICWLANSPAPSPADIQCCLYPCPPASEQNAGARELFRGIEWRSSVLQSSVSFSLDRGCRMHGGSGC